MLDKFIGDAIMAVFGLPVAHDDDEDRALRAAISMITSLRAFNVLRADEGKKPIDIGIGLNTDTVVSGNIGSPKRMDYTIIGDGVNLASRLESACKQYAARILISENTYRRLKGVYRVREVDQVIVKGKHEPVLIYEVLDYHTDETFPNLMEAVNHFNGGLSYYRKQQWERAAAAFAQASALNPHDKLPGLYVERCAHLSAEPPGDNWTACGRLSRNSVRADLRVLLLSAVLLARSARAQSPSTCIKDYVAPLWNPKYARSRALS